MVEGVHFFQSWAPTARSTSIKLLLAIAAIEDMDLVSFDVVSAFLGVPLKEDIYVFAPHGFMHEGKPVPKGHVLKLQKSCYGIKSASRYFWLAMNEHLKKIGFAPTQIDPCLYQRRTEHGHTLIGLIVDDMVCATTGDPEVLLAELRQRFDTTFEGDLSYVLGLHVSRDRSTRHVFLDQQGYIEKVARTFNMTGAPSERLPHDATIPKLSKADCVDYHGGKPPFPYRALVGSLLYAQTTRPDVAYRVAMIGRYSHSPGRPHWNAARHCLRYLSATSATRLRLGGLAVILYAYSDADWGGENAKPVDQCRSTSGVLIFLGDGPISWFSKLQRCTALSSTESEFIASAQAALGLLCACPVTCPPVDSDTPHGSHGYACKRVYEEAQTNLARLKELQQARGRRTRQVATCMAAVGIVGLRALLKELGYEQILPTYLFTDSKGAFGSIRNPINSKLRHVMMRYHRIRQTVKSGDVRPHLVRSDEQLADILTKSLSAPLFERMRPLSLGYGEKPALPEDLRSQLEGKMPSCKPIC